jgi:hypothetical protein
MPILPLFLGGTAKKGSKIPKTFESLKNTFIEQPEFVFKVEDFYNILFDDLHTIEAPHCFDVKLIDHFSYKLCDENPSYFPV